MGKGACGEARRAAPLLRPLGFIPTPGRRTVGDVLHAFLTAKRDRLRPRTLADYEAVCTRYLRLALGRVRLAVLDPLHVQRVFHDLAARGVTRQAAAFAVLQQALALAVRWGWPAANPCDRVEAPRRSRLQAAALGRRGGRLQQVVPQLRARADARTLRLRATGRGGLVVVCRRATTGIEVA